MMGATFSSKMLENYIRLHDIISQKSVLSFYSKSEAIQNLSTLTRNASFKVIYSKIWYNLVQELGKGLGDYGIGIQFLTEARDFAPLLSIETSLGAHSASYTISVGALYLGVRHQDDHSSPSSAEVNSGGAINLLPHTSSSHSAYLIKHRFNFTFTIHSSAWHYI
jgi:hypothetical protein